MMDEPKTVAPEPDQRQEWVTPELIVEVIKEVTLGGTGRFANFEPPEERITAEYRS